jgi:hypothetical protein
LEDYVKMDIKEIEYEKRVDWIHGYGSLAGSCEHCNGSSCFVEGGALLDQMSDY